MTVSSLLRRSLCATACTLSFLPASAEDQAGSFDLVANGDTQVKAGLEAGLQSVAYDGAFWGGLRAALPQACPTMPHPLGPRSM